MTDAVVLAVAAKLALPNVRMGGPLPGEIQRAREIVALVHSLSPEPRDEFAERLEAIITLAQQQRAAPRACGGDSTMYQAIGQIDALHSLILDEQPETKEPKQ